MNVFFFVPGLSHHLGSPVKLMILFLHAALFVVLSSLSPASGISHSLTCMYLEHILFKALILENVGFS